MAIKILNDENSYGKLIFEESFLTHEGFFAKVLVYKDELNRQKEKDREVALRAFFDNLNESHMQKASLYSKYHNPELQEQDTEDIYINKMTDEERELANKYTAHINFSELYIRYIYHFESDERPASFDDSIFLILEEIGFNREWVLNPVILKRKELVLAAEYAGQPFTHETFYTLLKQTMYPETEDI